MCCSNGTYKTLIRKGQKGYGTGKEGTGDGSERGKKG